MARYYVKVVEPRYAVLGLTVNAVSEKHAIKKAKQGKETHTEYLDGGGDVERRVAHSIKVLPKGAKR
jgi:hypothetical protein